MATVNIVFATIGGPSGAANAYNGGVLASENVTSSGVSAQSAASPTGCVARVTPMDGAVYVKADSSDPTAAAGSDYLVMTGSTVDLFINAGDKVAVIDA